MPERGTKTWTLPVVWANFELFVAIQMNFCGDWWPCTKSGGISMIGRQRNNQWSGGTADLTAPKFRVQKFVGKFLASIFGIKTESFPFSIFQIANLLTRSIPNLCWCNWRTFGRKTPREFHHVCLVPARQHPTHWPLETQKKLAYPYFQYLDRSPYSTDIASSDYPLFPGLRKLLKCDHIFPTLSSLPPRITGWAFKFLIFLISCKRYSNGLKMNCASLEVCWINSKFDCCRFFSAPPSSVHRL